MSRAPVNRILRSSIVDGPGNRAAVFLQGCNFDCVYCHNPETIALCNSCGTCLSSCPAGALIRGDLAPSSGEVPGGPLDAVLWKKERCVFCGACLAACPRNSSPRVSLMSPEEVMAGIEKDLPFIRGVTVSGGECTLYPAFLRELGTLVRDKGLTFFIDTNGSHDFSKPDGTGEGEGLLEVTDGVMLDVKADPENDEEHKRITGRSGYDILGLGEFLARRGKLYELRTVVSPGLFDAAALVDKTCRRLAGADSRLQYRLIRYRPAGVRPAWAGKLTVPGDSLMKSLAAICGGYGIKALVV
ncbi:MAG: YjjW family glycine radical enzyme activase [Treponema sp.]|nr:YjjW family glycine radical enzyme activase [Treponema sp.]